MIKVSIIEDEPEIRKLLRKIIERQEGFQVVSESGSFKEAVTDFAKYRPEVVFVDIDLNGPSGRGGLECAKVALSGIEEKLNPNEFMRCHKSYIINISMITKIEPYGRWTYVVKLKGTDATALITAQNYEVLKTMFG